MIRMHAILTVFLLFVFLLPFIAGSRLWNFWSLVLTILLLMVIWKILSYSRNSYQVITLTIILFLGLYAQWGVAQFILQGGLGLSILGETRLDPHSPGVAKFALDAEKLVRAYGPYTHANIYAGSLFLGLLLLLALINKFGFSLQPIFIYPIAFILVLGILLSFSRSAYIAVMLMSCLALKYRRWFWTWRAFMAPLLITIAIFYPLLTARFSDPDDRALAERLTGAKAAWIIMTTQSPWSGTGKNYLTRLREYYEVRMIPYQAWEIDYVHSVPLLLAAKAGIIPALLISVAIGYALTKLYGRHIIWLLPLAPLLLFDHYQLTHPEMLILTLLVVMLMPHMLT